MDITLGSSLSADFAFMLTDISEMNDPEKRFALTHDDFRLLNPNTRTCPNFSNRTDAELTISIYRNVPVLVDQLNNINPWGVSFRQGLFNMTSDSNLFESFPRNGNVPLYEAKMIHQFDHRFGTYEDATESNINEGNLPQFSEEMHADPHKYVLPRYWIAIEEIPPKLQGWSRDWLLGFRNVTHVTNERTALFSVIPLTGVGNSVAILFPDEAHVRRITSLLANTNSFVFDYVVRQKMSGWNMNFYLVEQYPVLPPDCYTPVLLDFIVPRVLELTYTAWDLQPFAQDVGWDGPPFVWDEQRRFLIRCELDALYFHLYGIARDDVDYIMETFPIIKRKDIAATATDDFEGEYITKRIILEMYDEMAALGVHEDADRIADFETWLSPPPADPRVAHEEK
jgi:hypothetical protein